MAWFTSASKNQCSAVVGFKWMLNQVDTLAGYKPTISLTSLMMDLKQMENMVLDALDYFRSTRHMVLYYEDLLKNRTFTKLEYSREEIDEVRSKLAERIQDHIYEYVWKFLRNSKGGLASELARFSLGTPELPARTKLRPLQQVAFNLKSLIVG